MDATLELPPLVWGIMGAGRVCHDFVQVRKLGFILQRLHRTNSVTYGLFVSFTGVP